MNDTDIILLILIALGFGFINYKINKLMDIASLSVSMQLGKIVTEQLDEETFKCSLKDEEDE